MSDSMYFLNVLFISVLFLAHTSTFKTRGRDLKPVVGCRGKLLGYNSSMSSARALKVIQHNLNNIKIPKKFDSRTKWKYCRSLNTIHNQGDCGGCWAFSSAAVMSDRLCIATEGKFNKDLSAQELMECCKKCVGNRASDAGGCEGGYMSDSFEYWETSGMVTGKRGCKPVPPSVLKGKGVKKCRRVCTNDNYKISYKKDKTFAVRSLKQIKPYKRGLKIIQAEIMKNGPVVACMDLYDYVSDATPGTILKYEPKKVGKHEKGDQHAIKIIGWDVKHGVDVWIIANSWGRDWCDDGFCSIRRGNNDFKLEEYDIVAGIPLVEGEEARHLAKAASQQKSGSTVSEASYNLLFLVVYSVMMCLR